MKNKWLLITMVCLLATSSFAETFTPSDIIKKYQMNRDGWNKYLTKGQQIRKTSDSTEKETWFSVQTYEFCTDGERLDLIYKNRFYLKHPNDKGLPQWTQNIRTIWDGNNYIDCYYAATSKERSQVYISNLKSRGEEDVDKVYPGAIITKMPIGGIEPIEKIFESATEISIRPAIEKVNDFNCSVIDAITPYGKYAVWFDCEHGYNIAKLKAIKIGTDLYYNEPVNKPPVFLEGIKFEGVKPGTKREFSFALEVAKFDKINDSVWIPIDANYEYNTIFQDGRTIFEQNHFTFTHVDPNPDFEKIGAFEPNIPDGTMTYLEYAPGIRYLWQDGKPVTYVDESFLDCLDSEIKQIKSGQEPNLPLPAKTEQQPTAVNKCNVPEVNQVKQSNVDNAVPPANKEKTNYATIAVIAIVVAIITGTMIYKFRRKQANV